VRRAYGRDRPHYKHDAEARLAVGGTDAGWRSSTTAGVGTAGKGRILAREDCKFFGGLSSTG
jgi:hypothetical protein